MIFFHGFTGEKTGLILVGGRGLTPPAPLPVLSTPLPPPPPTRRGKVVVFEHVPDSVPADFMLCNTRIQIAGSLPAGHCQSTQCAPARLLWAG